MPFLQHLNQDFLIDLKKLLTEFFPSIDFYICAKNPMTIGSFFKFKDRVPDILRTKIIYKFTCPNCELGVYIGSSIRSLKARIYAHMGRSLRTDRPIKSLENSSIREHSYKCNLELSNELFEIIDSTDTEVSLRILESIYIKTMNPPLNKDNSAYPLSIL